MHKGIDALVRQHHDGDEALVQLETRLREDDWEAIAAAFAHAAAVLRENFDAEEARLFPAFERAMCMKPGITAIMRREHACMRTLLANAAEWLELRDAGALAAEIGTLVVLLQRHNETEESVVFPMCEQCVPHLDAVLAAVA